MDSSRLVKLVLLSAAISLWIAVGVVWGMAALADLSKPVCSDGRVAVFVARDGWFCVVGEPVPPTPET